MKNKIIKKFLLAIPSLYFLSEASIVVSNINEARATNVYTVTSLSDVSADGSTFTVGATSGSLRQGILNENFYAGDPGGTGYPNASPYTITFTSSISGGTVSLADNLPLIFGNTIIDGTGANITVDGGSAHRGFFVSGLSSTADGLSAPAINVTFKGLTIQKCTAKGGNSRIGGGGMGAGGALFIGPNANVTLENTSFSGNSATGGSANITNSEGGGGMGGDGGPSGGGGLGGAGGYDSGGGIGGNGGGNDGTSGAVGSGGGGFGGSGIGQILQGQFSGAGGQPGSTGSGGSNGGGGGGSSTSGAVGDSTGAGGNATGSGYGGAGGIAGNIGGGGGGGNTNTTNGGFGGGGSDGVNGSFGGGGGYAANGGFGGGGGGNAGAGGFGGGGGGVSGAGGFGGGNGATSNIGGGGGAAMGAGIFVYGGTSGSPSSLTINGTYSLSGGSLTAGTGSGSGASNGSTYGEGFFLYGYGTLNLTPSSGQTQTIADNIADQTGSGDTTLGSWGLTKLGSGSLILSGGNNTYTGATTISVGTLQAGAANTLSPNSAVTNNATLDLNSNTQTIASLAGTTTAATVTLGSATLTTGGDNTSTSFAGVISGTGGLTKNGTGTFTLSNANTYTGLTTISAGGLEFSGDTSSLTGNISNAGALIFNQSANSSYSGVISGAGTVAKQGSGTLTLSGANTNTSTTTISAGTLQAGAANTFSSSSAVTNNGTLDLNNYAQTIASLAGTTTSATVTLGSATLTTGGDNTSTSFAGIISGTGGLTKTGTGTFTVSNSNTYSGATTVSGGTFQAGAAGAFSPNSAVINDGTLDLNSNNQTIASLAGTTSSATVTLGSATLTTGGDNTSTSFAGIISGTGGLTKTGTGALTLSNANTYTGLTTINAGGLEFSGDTSSLTGNTSNAGALIFNQSANSSYSGVISGGGSLTQSGSAILTLSGANTNTGTTTISSGTLQAGAAGAFSSGSAVTNNGTLDLNNYAQTIASLAGTSTSATVTLGSATLTTGGDNTSTSFAGIVSGTGGLIKNGTGTLTLAGANTYSGITDLSAGTLELSGDTSSLTGNISNAGALIFNQSANSSYSGVISGAGTVTKQGSGTLTLSGTHTYTGDTNIDAGALSVNGSLDSSGSVIVNSGGTLKGIGSLGNISVSGKIAPGNSIGTINVTSINFSGGGTYDAEVAANGTSDLIKATGTATLTGGTLNVILSGAYSSSMSANTYTIIQASSINGTFANETSSSALDYKVIYNTTSVQLTKVYLNYAKALPSNSNSNLVQMANYLTAASSNAPTGSDLANVLSALNNYISSGDTAAYVSALDQMQPSRLTQGSVAAFITQTGVSENLRLLLSSHRLQEEEKEKSLQKSDFYKLVEKTRQFGSNFKDIVKNFASSSTLAETGSLRNVGVPVSQRIKIGKANVWLQALGQVTSLKTSPYANGFSSRGGGFSLGGDYTFAKKTYAGAFAGYADTPFDWKENGGHADVKSYYGGIYGTKIFDNNLYLSLQLNGGWEKYNATRYITLPVTRNAHSHHNGAHFFTSLEAGKAFAWKDLARYTTLDFQVEPFANLTYAFFHEKGYTETGANSLDWNVRSRHSNFLRVEAGARFYQTYERHGALIRPEFSLSYLNTSQIGGGRGNIKSNLVGQQSLLVVKGNTKTINQVAPALSLTAQLKNGFYFIGDIRGEIGKNLRATS